MALTNSQYDQIMRSYEAKQRISRLRLEEKKKSIYAAVPALQELEDRIASFSVQQARMLLEGDQSALDTLRDQLTKARKKRTDLLTQAGFSPEDLSPVYTCPDCQDTGYIGTEKCHCFKQAIISLLFHQSHINELLETENFDNLSYEFYQGDDLHRFRNAEQTARNFVKNFNSDYHNLFFYGTVGTGKSFLSACIAKELLNKGNSVVYFSATEFFEQMAQHTFRKAGSESDVELSDITSCDLLIIDDLGTELMNQFVASSLFSCLTSRHLAKKATIISTNLSLEELRDRYSDRVFSRITSQFELCKLTGPDIRIIKKRNRK